MSNFESSDAVTPRDNVLKSCSSHHLRWCDACHGPPEVASVASARLPRISIDECEVVHQAGAHVLRRIARHSIQEADGRVRRSASLVEVHHVRRIRVVLWPIRCRVCSHGRCRVGPVGDERRDGRVAQSHKIAPDGCNSVSGQAASRPTRLTHKGPVQVGSLINLGWSKVRRQIRRVRRRWHRVLVVVSGAALARIGFREPVAGADKGRFGVYVLRRDVSSTRQSNNTMGTHIRALLLTSGKRADVDGRRASVAKRCECGVVGVDAGVGAWVVHEDFGDVVICE